MAVIKLWPGDAPPTREPKAQERRRKGIIQQQRGEGNDWLWTGCPKAKAGQFRLRHAKIGGRQLGRGLVRERRDHAGQREL